MSWLITFAGAVLVLGVLRDVFHTLWHPTRHGGLSRLVMTVLWRLPPYLPLHRRSSGLAGPLAMVGVVAVWTVTMVVGWALVYWPHMPQGFTYTAGLRPADHAGFPDALYVSLVHISTLGLGDIAPAHGWLRILAPLEALVGFALLSATVAWTLGIYPALARRRALALRLSHLARTHPTTDQIDAGVGACILDGLAGAVTIVSVDFQQYAESSYFHDGDDRTSLACQITCALNLADQAAIAHQPDVRLAAGLLRAALEDLAAILDERFLRTRGPVREVFDAFALDHGRHLGEQL
ncbi:potassium channel family protein [Streptomyces sp. NPDC058612]|uniref:potassium channel family protein n=1 Tax=Streptomyces sp. NPDC058612 TaxID=3346555 RepID=UPI00366A1464